MINIRDTKLLSLFGLHLRKLRLESGLSQQKLAFKAVVSMSQIRERSSKSDTQHIIGFGTGTRNILIRNRKFKLILFLNCN